MLPYRFGRRALVLGATGAAVTVATSQSARPASAVVDYTTRSAFDSAWNYAQSNALLPLVTDDNTNGVLGWQTGYVMPALLQMYLAHGDTAYLDDFATFANGVLTQRDHLQGTQDWRGLSLKGWSRQFTGTYPPPATSCDRVSFSGRIHQTVETGMIARPLAWFARIVSETPALQTNPAYAALANDCFTAAADAIAIHEADWIQVTSSTGTYSIPRGAAHPYDGMQTPFNMSHTLAHTQLHLAPLATSTDEARYRSRASSALQLWRSDLPPLSSTNSYPWHYHWSDSWGYTGWDCSDMVSIHHPSNPPFSVVEDPSHGALTADFVWQAREDGLLIAATEMSRVANTFDAATISTSNGPRLAKFIDGTGTPRAAHQYMAGIWSCLASANSTNSIQSTSNAIFNSIPDPTIKSTACSWLHSISSLNRFA